MEQPPGKSTMREVGEVAAKATAGLVPLAGGPLAELLGYMMTAAYSRRWQQWAQQVAEAIIELQELTEDWPRMEDLPENDIFLDAVANAGRVAQATHQQEKLRALRNAVLNSIGPEAPAIDEQLRFLRLIEEFTPAHLRLLSFLDDPGAAFDAAGIPRPNLLMGGRSSLLGALPEWAAHAREWIDLVAGDLTSAALTNGAGMHSIISGQGLWQSATSPLGRRFLAFVRTPTPLSAREDRAA